MPGTARAGPVQEARLRRLKGEIPRAYRDHRGRAGRTYGGYCCAVLARFGGTVPPDVRPTVKAAGVCAVELDALTEDLEAARQRRRVRDCRRIRREMAILRTQLVTLERHLAERMNGHPMRPAGPLTAADLEAFAPAPQNRERP